MGLAGAFTPLPLPMRVSAAAPKGSAPAAASPRLWRRRLQGWRGGVTVGGAAVVTALAAMPWEKELESPFNEDFPWAEAEPALQTVDAAAQVWSDGEKVRVWGNRRTEV